MHKTNIFKERVNILRIANRLKKIIFGKFLYADNCKFHLLELNLKVHLIWFSLMKKNPI